MTWVVRRHVDEYSMRRARTPSLCRFFTYWLLNMLCHQNSVAMFRLMGAVSRTLAYATATAYAFRMFARAVMWTGCCCHWYQHALCTMRRWYVNIGLGCAGSSSRSSSSSLAALSFQSLTSGAGGMRSELLLQASHAFHQQCHRLAGTRPRILELHAQSLLFCAAGFGATGSHSSPGRSAS